MLNQEVVLIIVIYHPDLKSFIDKIKGIYGYTIILVDNSNKDIHSLFLQDNIIYKPLLKNHGIAYAQNIGIDEAINRNFDYIIFFDQDTNFSVEIIENLVNHYKQLITSNGTACIMGAVIIDKGNEKVYDHRLNKIHEGEFVQVDRIISSGMIIRSSLVSIAGKMNEEMFIDYVDSEFCWRMKVNGYYTFIDSSIKIQHSIGNKIKEFGFFKILLSAPFRYYYQYRNFIYLLSKKYVPLSWKIKNFIRKSLELFIVPILLRNSVCFNFMRKGIVDGIKNKMGSYDENIDSLC